MSINPHEVRTASVILSIWLALLLLITTYVFLSPLPFFAKVLAGSLCVILGYLPEYVLNNLRLQLAHTKSDIQKSDWINHLTLRMALDGFASETARNGGQPPAAFDWDAAFAAAQKDMIDFLEQKRAEARFEAIIRSPIASAVEVSLHVLILFPLPLLAMGLAWLCRTFTPAFAAVLVMGW